MQEEQQQQIQTEHFDCICHSSEHSVQFDYDPEEGELFMTVFLYRWPFLKRLWIGIKYIFGYKSRFGDFDGGFSLRREDLPRFKKLIERAEAYKEEKEG